MVWGRLPRRPNQGFDDLPILVTVLREVLPNLVSTPNCPTPLISG